MPTGIWRSCLWSLGISAVTVRRSWAFMNRSRCAGRERTWRRWNRSSEPQSVACGRLILSALHLCRLQQTLVGLTVEGGVDGVLPTQRHAVFQRCPAALLAPQRGFALGAPRVASVGVAVFGRDIGLLPDGFAFITAHQPVRRVGLDATDADTTQTATANRAIVNRMFRSQRSDL